MSRSSFLCWRLGIFGALLLWVAASLLGAELPPEDLLRSLPYDLGPFALLTRPARGEAVRWDTPPPRETHRRVSIELRPHGAEVHLHQVFFNASHQPLEVIALEPRPNPSVHSRVRWRSPSLPSRPASQELDSDQTQSWIRRWALAGGNPSACSIWKTPSRVHGPVLVGSGGYIKLDLVAKLNFPEEDLALRSLSILPGPRKFRPLYLDALEIEAEEIPGSEISSPTHRLIPVPSEGPKAELTVTQSLRSPPTPLHLTWPSQPGRAVSAQGRTPQGAKLLWIQRPPRKLPPETRPRTWILLSDTGGSLAGPPLEERVRTIQGVLEALRPRDSFEVISFSLDPAPLFGHPVAATPENISKALQALRGLRPRGAVHFEAAITTGLEIAAEAPAKDRKSLLIFTDGRPSLGSGDPREILGLGPSEPIPIYPVAKGPSVDYSFLEKLARITGGASIFPEEGSDPVPEILSRVEPALASYPAIYRDGAELVPTGDGPRQGPWITVLPDPGGSRFEVEGRILRPKKDLGLLPFSVQRTQSVGREIWAALDQKRKFPGGALSFRLLGIVPGTPRTRILQTLRDGVGALGRARMLAIQGVLDQGTFQPVVPSPAHTWSGNRFFERNSEKVWVESGLNLSRAELVSYGSRRHQELARRPEILPHLSLGRDLALFEAPEQAVWIQSPKELP